MKKYIVAIVFFAIILPIAWYLVSPIWNVQELQEASPLAKSEKIQEAKPEQMSPEEEEQFKKAMEETQAQPVKEITDDTPSSATVIARGSFAPEAHEVSGGALIIEQGGTRTLRFENFETINGPDLHIYLATDTSATDTIDLGPIRATKGNVNYPFPDNVDLTKYNTVLIWCVPFRVLFSSAELGLGNK